MIDPSATQPARWYHLAGRVQHGPMPRAEIRDRILDGTVAPDTYVWSDGMPDWLPARRVPALVPLPELDGAPTGWRDQV